MTLFQHFIRSAFIGGLALLLQTALSQAADKPAASKPKLNASLNIEEALEAAKIEFQKDGDGNITEVTFGAEDKGPISVANLKLAAKITTLKTLGSRLSSDHVSTEELGAVASIKSIETLKFDCCQFKGSDLKKLMGLPKLTTIDWTDSQIDDDGMRGIGMLKSLTVLKLKGNQVTDAGVKFLSKLKDLEVLNLDKSRDDIHIEKAAPITDAALVTLKPMKQLQSLSLRRNAITDAGLKHLADFKSLKELDLAMTQVTDAGIAKLQLALPDCKINTKE